MANDGEKEWKIKISGSGVDTGLTITISTIPDNYQKWLAALRGVTLVEGRQVQDIQNFSLTWSDKTLLVDSDFEPLNAHEMLSDPEAKTLQLVIKECDVLREGERSKREATTEDQPEGAIPIYTMKNPPKGTYDSFSIHSIKPEATEGKSEAAVQSKTGVQSSLQVSSDTPGENQSNKSKNSTLLMVIAVAVIGVAVGVVVSQSKVNKASLQSVDPASPFECGIVGSISEGGSCRCMRGLTMQTENAEEGTMACYANAASRFTEGSEKLWHFQKKQLKCCIAKGDPPATRLQDLKGDIPPSPRLMVLDKYGCGSMFGDRHQNGPKHYGECWISIDALMDTLGKGFKETMELLGLEIETAS